MSTFTDRATIAQSCTVGSWLTIRVVVSDSVGSAGEDTFGPFQCPSISW